MSLPRELLPAMAVWQHRRAAMPGAAQQHIRLNKYLALAGLTSRRGADVLMRAGAVTVNGNTVGSLGMRIDPERDRVRVHGKLVRRLEPKVYLVLNKPRGYICTLHDEHDRPTVLDLVPAKPRIFPVGRLDYDAVGVLILTNDGDLAQTLLHPRSRLPRTYLVKVRGQPDTAALQRLTDGITLSDGWRARVEASLEPSRAKHAWLRLILREGRHGQIKEMCRAIGHPVLKLKRISFGSLTVEGLKVGAWRKIRERELATLRRAYRRPAR